MNVLLIMVMKVLNSKSRRMCLLCKDGVENEIHFLFVVRANEYICLCSISKHLIQRSKPYLELYRICDLTLISVHQTHFFVLTKHNLGY